MISHSIECMLCRGCYHISIVLSFSCGRAKAGRIKVGRWNERSAVHSMCDARSPSMGSWWCRVGLARALFQRFRRAWRPAKFSFLQTGKTYFLSVISGYNVKYINSFHNSISKKFHMFVPVCLYVKLVGRIMPKFEFNLKMLNASSFH